jgi:hypothetical protein
VRGRAHPPAAVCRSSGLSGCLPSLVRCAGRGRGVLLSAGPAPHARSRQTAEPAPAPAPAPAPTSAGARERRVGRRWRTSSRRLARSLARSSRSLGEAPAPALQDEEAPGSSPPQGRARGGRGPNPPRAGEAQLSRITVRGGVVVPGEWDAGSGGPGSLALACANRCLQLQEALVGVAAARHLLLANPPLLPQGSYCGWKCQKLSACLERY